MSVFSLPMLLLLACTSTSYCERCGMLGDRLDLPRVRLTLVCYNTCIDECRLHAYQEQLCLAHNPHWKSERVTRKGCKTYSNSFQERRGYGIIGHNNLVVHATVSTCKSLCIHAREFVCVSFDYYRTVKSVDNCYLSEVGYLDIPQEQREYNATSWTLYERKCRKY